MTYDLVKEYTPSDGKEAHPDSLHSFEVDWLWDEKLGTHSNREKYLTMFEDIKDDDDAGPSFIDFDACIMKI
ncbi:hypothetical protein L6452_25317 [Arctium lappa]|uniref:Uncharacterized protein n=1 Tax=Arctium lappa TaxID=4217 RepID=A0ACB9ABJ3_ARCLA|nr:hypothetical protein L6452_25317 [Arctium lappa]